MAPFIKKTNQYGWSVSLLAPRKQSDHISSRIIAPRSSPFIQYFVCLSYHKLIFSPSTNFWVFGNRRGKRDMWGLFAGFARKQPPHMTPTTADPRETVYSFMKAKRDWV